jgi:cysteinyl-tRNA synthetase
MDDDLNTAKAKQVLMEFVSRAGSELESGARLDEEIAEKIEEFFGILGVTLDPEVSETESGMADLLLELREDARDEAEYETADMIRERLQELGFDVEDTEEGSLWTR